MDFDCIKSVTKTIISLNQKKNLEGYMVKIFLDKNKTNNPEKQHTFEKIKEYLAENNLCYVLLTCSRPSEEGEMQMEMSYEGEDHVASYLIESAHEIIFGREGVCKDNN